MENKVRNIRIYQPGNYTSGDTIALTDSANQHVGVVLRMRSGEKITLFSGNNYEYYGIIAAKSTKKQIYVDIESMAEINKESPTKIHLAQAISKGERMEMVMQKAVELGVASITPIISQHCAVKMNKERLDKKLVQWQAIAISACEQCGRNYIPLIHPPTPFLSYIKENKSSLKLILNPEQQNSWRSLTLTNEIALLIGPEGGFSQEEVKQAEQYHFNSLCLGPRILRTETAAIASLSILQALGGDL